MSDTSFRRGEWTDWPVWDLHVLEPATGRVIGLALVAGIAFDVGVQSGVVTAGGSLAVLAAAAALLASGRIRTVTSRACVCAAAVLGLFLALRTSEWLLALNLLGATCLFLLAGLLARDGRWSDLSARLLASRAVVTIGHAFGAAAFLLTPLRKAPRATSRSAASVLRGIALAVPLVVVLGALLASADAVFASALRVDIPVPTDAIGHIVLVLIGTLGVGGVLRTASAVSGGEVPAVDRRLGPVEWSIILGGLVVLFSAFAVAQVVTLTGGARHVLETEGLTYAEYARSGYVQLLVVAVLTGLVVAGLSGVAAMPSPAARRWFIVLAELTVLLTGIILVVALRRLGLYEDAYGWTMSRLISKAGVVWLGIALILAAVRLAGWRRDWDWFVPATLSTGVAILVALNVMNPEAMVARHNLGLEREIDPYYLALDLSDDAIPTIIDALPTLATNDRQLLQNLLCSSRDEPETGFLSWNRAEATAEDARDRVCEPSSS